MASAVQPKKQTIRFYAPKTKSRAQQDLSGPKTNSKVLLPHNQTPRTTGNYRAKNQQQGVTPSKTKPRAQRGVSGGKNQQQRFYSLKTKPRAQRDLSGREKQQRGATHSKPNPAHNGALEVTNQQQGSNPR